MRRFLFCLLIFIPLFSSAQDLIITTAKDSIYAEIISQEGDELVYSFVNPNTGAVKQVTMSMKDVLILQYGVETKKGRRYAFKTDIYSKWRLSLGGGYSRRLSRLPSGLNEVQEEYFNELRSCFVVTGDISYFFSAKDGIGLKFNRNTSSNSFTGIFTDIETGESFESTLSDDVAITYFGLMYVFRQYTRGGEDALILNFALGYTHYQNRFNLLGERGTLTGRSLGLYLEAGYDFSISRDLALGLQVGLGTGYFEKFEIEDASGTINSFEFADGEGEGLLRLDITAGIRFK